jgi:uncharacterized membrane protein YhaH (DUF805 family)
MTGFFELLFSPSGCVGRAVWWISLILIMIFAGVVSGIAGYLVVQAQMAANPDIAAAMNAHTLDLSKYSSAQMTHYWNTLWVAAQSVQYQLYPLGVLYLLAVWSGLAIEIKRWHDRGMSGFFVLLRFVPTGFWMYVQMNPKNMVALAIAAAISIFLALFVLIQLGFLAGVQTGPSPVSKRNYGPSQTRGPVGPARPVSQSSSGFGTFLFGFICAVFLVGGVGGAYYFEYGSLPGLPLTLTNSTNSVANVSAPASGTATNAPAADKVPVSAPVATNAPAPPVAPMPASAPVDFTQPQAPPKNIGDNVLSRESGEHDSMSAMYGKNWVIANGEKLSGITQITALPGYQVHIVYALGDTTLKAATLPTDFLNQWSITPEALEIANRPPQTNQ